MEEALNADFSAVRIHDGPEAVAAACAVAASMYTSGAHIVIGEGHADIGSVNERRPIAHELYHVKQQSEGPVAGTPTSDGLAISDPSDAYERAAEQAAERTAEHITGSHPPAGASRTGSAIPVQRQTDDQPADKYERADDLVRRILAEQFHVPEEDITRYTALIDLLGVHPWETDQFRKAIQEACGMRIPESELDSFFGPLGDEWSYRGGRGTMLTGASLVVDVVNIVAEYLD